MLITTRRPWNEIPIEALAEALASVDRSTLTDEETVAVLRSRQRLINHLMAERAADIVEVSRRHQPRSPGGDRSWPTSPVERSPATRWADSG
jgi:hypothetical protein